MAVYEMIKDAIGIAQKADNIPLLNTLIDAQKQILDLIHENGRLRDEIKELKEKDEISARIERHKDPYITLKDDEQGLIYCSNCWDEKRKLIQAIDMHDGKYRCPSCKIESYYNKNEYDKKIAANMRALNDNTKNLRRFLDYNE